MIHFKGHNFSGFTFVEVVLTVAIIGTVLTALFSLQSGIFRSTFNDYSKISRFFYMKNFFFDLDDLKKIQKDKNIKQELQDPPTKLNYEFKKVSDKSELKKFDNIFLIKGNASWQGMFRQQEESLVSFIFSRSKQ